MHNIELTDPQQTSDTLVAFIKNTFANAQKTDAVIAVSGGIDSALSLTLLTQALGSDHVWPVLLPYGNQNMDDAQAVCEHNGIAKNQITTINIQPLADLLSNTLNANDPVRKGNIMARTRMIAVYDLAKAKDALVCGTENKSEHYLGYFTRFGDAASDLEPISSLYKTQVRQLAQHLHLPQAILDKHPSAGLWENQTDERELGFTYAVADKVISALFDEHAPEENLTVEEVPPATTAAVLARVRSQRFKLDVPYNL